MAFDGEKAATRSLGVMAPALAILVVVAKEGLGVVISAEEVQAILDGVGNTITQVAALCGLGGAIVGRLRASSTITRFFG